MDMMNGTKDGVPIARPPDPPLLADGGPNPPSHSPMMNVDKSPMTKFTFQAKVNNFSNGSGKTPLRPYQGSLDRNLVAASTC
jgi:hypothetical protein